MMIDIDTQRQKMRRALAASRDRIECFPLLGTAVAQSRHSVQRDLKSIASGIDLTRPEVRAAETSDILGLMGRGTAFPVVRSSSRKIGVLIVEHATAANLIAIAAGGKCQPGDPTQPAPLSKIEARVLRKAAQSILNGIDDALALFVGASPQISIGETALDASDSEKQQPPAGFAIAYAITCDGLPLGGITCFLPWDFIEELRHRMASDNSTRVPGSALDDSHAPKSSRSRTVDAVRLKLNAVAGHAEISFQELRDIAVGNTFELQTLPSGRAILEYDGRPLAQCEPGRQGARIAVKVLTVEAGHLRSRHLSSHPA